PGGERRPPQRPPTGSWSQVGAAIVAPPAPDPPAPYTAPSPEALVPAASMAPPAPGSLMAPPALALLLASSGAVDPAAPPADVSREDPPDPVIVPAAPVESAPPV